MRSRRGIAATTRRKCRTFTFYITDSSTSKRIDLSIEFNVGFQIEILATRKWNLRFKVEMLRMNSSW